jgi:hypothetical protein
MSLLVLLFFTASSFTSSKYQRFIEGKHALFKYIYVSFSVKLTTDKNTERHIRDSEE